MKRILLFLCALLLALSGRTAPVDKALKQLLGEVRATMNQAQSMSAGELDRTMAEVHQAIATTDREIDRAIAEARAAIDAAECSDIASQSLDELNKAAREQIVRELGLTSRQRKEFEPIYKAYRETLDRAIDTDTGSKSGGDENTENHNLKAKLSNISAAAQVKRDYVDKFAAVLTADQIRRLYNTEGEVATSIKRAAAVRAPRISNLRGSNRMVTQDWGTAGNYTAITASAYCCITLSPTARTVSVTADDNVIDYIDMVNQGGELIFTFNSEVNRIENVHIEITVPLSTSLQAVNAKAYGKVIATVPLKGASMKIGVSSYGAVTADIETSGTTQVTVSGYGHFKGSVLGDKVDYSLSSYAHAEGNIESRGSCRLQLSSYSRFADEVKASDLSLTISGYAKFTGAVTATKAQITTSGYSSFAGAFSGNSLVATIASYASISISGSAQVADAQITLSYNASYNAPQLRVVNYTIKASNSSRSDVWCSGLLKFDGPPQARLTYAGPCKLEAPSQNINRRQ